MENMLNSRSGCDFIGEFFFWFDLTSSTSGFFSKNETFLLANKMSAFNVYVHIYNTTPK